jgi:hypothetical protein
LRFVSLLSALRSRRRRMRVNRIRLAAPS